MGATDEPFTQQAGRRRNAGNARLPRDVRYNHVIVDNSDFRQQREQMVRQHLIARGIADERVLEAMRTVPRERFVSEHYLDMSYRDGPLPIECGQTISQPYIVALMAEAMEIGPDDRVLEVGAGSGYAAAVLSRIAAQVYAIEYHRQLADQARARLAELGYDNVEVKCGDGTRGWPEQAPFDAIMVSAGGREVPRPLKQQLEVGGRLVIPVGDGIFGQELLRVRRIDERNYDQDTLCRVQFVPLVGGESSP